MGVPNIFANATTTIPLAQLDQNFATPVTIGATSVGLGNTSASFTPNSTVGIIGTTTNDSAQSGSFGEFGSFSLASGNAVSVPANQTPVDVLSVQFGPGDYDISGVGSISQTSNVVTFGFGSVWLNTTSGTVPSLPDESFAQTVSGTAEINVASYAIPTGTKRFSFAGNTTVYLSARTGYSGGQCTVYGIMRYRRMR